MVSKNHFPFNDCSAYLKKQKSEEINVRNLYFSTRHRVGIQAVASTTGPDGAVLAQPCAEAHQWTEGEGQGPRAILQVLHEHLQGQ